MLLSQIAQHLAFDLPCNDREIAGINALASAAPSELSFCRPNAKAALAQTRAGVVLVPPSLSCQCPQGVVPWPVPQPALAMARISALFAHAISENRAGEKEPRLGQGVSVAEHVHLGKGVLLGDGVRLYPGVFLGEGVCVGDRTVIHPNVCVYPGCVIGADCILHAGVVVGCDGFGYEYDSETGERVKMHQLGVVRIADHVEIGANTVIDRATFGETRIAKGTKLDNLIHVGHNCQIGENTVVCAQSGFAGLTVLGRGVTIGPQAGVAGHLTVADGVVLAARGGITKTIRETGTYAGFPAKPHKAWLKGEAAIRRLQRNQGQTSDN